MKLDEAISRLNHIKIHGADIPNEFIDVQRKDIEALEMGIKALSDVAENTTTEQFGNSEELDCISREQAIKCLECDFNITGRANMEVVVNYINSAHDKIINLPSVKAEPKIKLLSAEEAIQRLAYKTPHIAYAFQEDIEYMADAGFRICEVKE